MSPRGRLTLPALAAFALVACGAGPRGAPAPSPAHTRAASDSLLRVVEVKIRSHDYSAQNDVRGLGDGASRLLERLATDHDAEVRALAVLCLESAGGLRGAKILGEALNDPSPEVRLNASQSLQRRPLAGALPYLLSALRNSSDPAVRKNCALAIGMIPGAGASELRGSSLLEKDPDVKLACLQARARLGETEARREFAAGLRSAEGQVRPMWLERCEYIGQPWLLPPLVSWVDDTLPAVRIGADGLPGPQYLRVCDVVINLAAAVGRPVWSLKTAPAKNYTAAERTEARRVLAGLR